MKFKRNPSASPIFSKQSPARQDEVNPTVSEDGTSTYQEPSKIDIYNQLYNKVSTEVRENLGRKEKGAVTTIEKKNEGMQRVFEAIESGADKKEITKIVREHNRDLYGSVESGEVVRHKGFPNARIGLKEAFSYIPETVDKTTQVEEKTQPIPIPSGNYERDDAIGERWGSNFTLVANDGTITGRVIKNPNYDPSKPEFSNEYIVSRDPSQWASKYRNINDELDVTNPMSINYNPQLANPKATQGKEFRNDPIKRAGFKKLKFGRRK